MIGVTRSARSIPGLSPSESYQSQTQYYALSNRRGHRPRAPNRSAVSRYAVGRACAVIAMSWKPAATPGAPPPSDSYTSTSYLASDNWHA
jgi:hypothetical protein